VGDSSVEMLSIGSAAAYVVANWDRLTHFVQEQRIPLENNASERGIRLETGVRPCLATTLLVPNGSLRQEPRLGHGVGDSSSGTRSRSSTTRIRSVQGRASVAE
jgi:hypothetical protein